MQSDRNSFQEPHVLTNSAQNITFARHEYGRVRVIRIKMRTLVQKLQPLEKCQFLNCSQLIASHCTEIIWRLRTVHLCTGRGHDKAEKRGREGYHIQSLAVLIYRLKGPVILCFSNSIHDSHPYMVKKSRYTYIRVGRLFEFHKTESSVQNLVMVGSIKINSIFNWMNFDLGNSR